MAQTKPKAGQFYGVSGNGTDGQFLKTDGTGGMSWDDPITNPTLTSIDYPGTQTAADPAGGESVIINGTGFVTGITCTVGGTSATTAFNSATQITITTPAKAAGQYTIAVTNTNGGNASQANFIQYSGVPIWSTASGSLGSVTEGSAASFQVTATEGSDTIEYAVTTGSLPSGLSLNTNTGAITGTAPSVSADTTTTFSITATDDENQTSSARSFSITVTNNNPSNYFNTVLYTGTSASHPITGVGFQPDFVWIKRRSSAENSALYDSIRGVNKQLESNTTNAQATNTAPYEGFTAFGTDGFTVDNNGGTNSSGETYVAWCFKAGGTPSATNSAGAGNAPTSGSVMIDGSASTAALAGTNPAKKISANNSLGFSIVQYTANGTGGATIAHGLNAAPDLIILKNLDRTGYGWLVYQKDVSPAAALVLNTADASSTGAGYFDNAATTSTVFTLGSDTFGNYNGDDYIAYCYNSKPGFSATGSYVGNGSSAGPMVNVGFEPAFLMIKRTDSARNWRIIDNKRSPNNPRDKEIYPNLNNAEGTYVSVNFLSNGFQIINTDISYNASGGTYIYFAIAADPSTTTPSLANSFAAEIYSGNSSTQQVTSGFRSDLVWIKARNGTWNWVDFDTVRSMLIPYSYRLNLNTTSAQSNWAPTAGISAADATSITILDPGGQGYGMNTTGEDYVTYNWKAGGLGAILTNSDADAVDVTASVNNAAGFSIVGGRLNSGSGVTKIPHGLSAAPDFILIKSVDQTSNWQTYHTSMGAGKYILLDSTNASQSSTDVWANTTPTSDLVSVKGGYVLWGGADFIMYSWKAITGYSAFGTYTASGSAGSPTITTGFEPGFVMIKNIDRNQEWIIVDSTRGLNKSLQPNSTATEGTNGNTLSSTPTSFTIEVGGGGVNYASGDTMLYAAFKQN